MSYNGIPVELAEDGALLGITYWVEWLYYPAIPKFRIYTYIGKTLKGPEEFVFINRNTGFPIFKRFDELNSKTFKPFLINMERISKAVKEQEHLYKGY